MAPLLRYYLLLDTGSKAYQASIVVYHHHNHPVLRVAAWAMDEDSHDRRDAVKRKARGLCKPSYRRVANRWQKALFLVRNPRLAKYVASTAGFKENKAMVKGASKVQSDVTEGIEDNYEDVLDKLYRKVTTMFAVVYSDLCDSCLPGICDV